MTSIRHLTQDGFTAVELLITLLIASMFLFAGYQLYTQVTRDGADANRTASVSALAINRLQEAARGLSGTCTTSSSSTTVNEPGIGSVIYAINVSCPSSSVLPTLKLVKIDATIQTNPTRTVTHAMYAK